MWKFHIYLIHVNDPTAYSSHYQQQQNWVPVTFISSNLLTSLSCFIDCSDAGCWGGSDAFFPASRDDEISKHNDKKPAATTSVFKIINHVRE